MRAIIINMLLLGSIISTVYAQDCETIPVPDDYRHNGKRVVGDLCKNEGAKCSIGKCRTVFVGLGDPIRASCDCLVPGCLMKGQWYAMSDGAQLEPGSVLTLELIPHEDNYLVAFDSKNVKDDGTIDEDKSQQFNTDIEFFGSLSLFVEKNADGQVTAKIANAKAEFPSMEFLGMSSGTNIAIPGPGFDEVEASVDMELGIIDFENKIPVIGMNEIFPDGQDMSLQLSLQQTDDLFYAVNISLFMDTSGFVESAVSNWWMELY